MGPSFRASSKVTLLAVQGYNYKELYPIGTSTMLLSHPRRSGQKSHDPVKLNKRLRCHVCRIRQKKQKTTFFTCSSCTDEKDKKFELCMPECFNEWHK
ncbi:hypothetical protein J6590_075521 [Homalodisca vitripennis]|nr:hypothetical protein J6590_075521 [Homalodisca vitripennis]